MIATLALALWAPTAWAEEAKGPLLLASGYGRGLPALWDESSEGLSGIKLVEPQAPEPDLSEAEPEQEPETTYSPQVDLDDSSAPSSGVHLGPIFPEFAAVDLFAANYGPPGSYKLGPITARFQVTSSVSNPGAWRGDLAEPLGSGSGALPSYLTSISLMEKDQYQGMVALEWRSGRVGVTLGGGYTQTYAADSYSSSYGGASRGAASTSGSSGTRFDSYGRWTAYVSVPLSLGSRFSLSPEFSYNYEDKPEAAQEKSDEWVMGLQFRIGF